MADRAEKCAEELAVRANKRTNLEMQGHHFTRTMKVKEDAAIIRSHYPDDRELLEAAKEWEKANREYRDNRCFETPVRVRIQRELREAEERLRTAIERIG